MLGSVTSSALSTDSKQWEGYNGIFTNRSKTTFGQISDGSSNTLLFGEIAGQSGGSKPTGYAWMGAINLSMFYWEFDRAGLTSGQLNSMELNKYNSYHPGVVNFARGDGSVATVPQSADLTTMYQLSAMGDGNVVSFDF